MKITQITATSAWDEVYRIVHERIYGLGEDNKVYCWSVDREHWCLFSDNEEPNHGEIDKEGNSIS